MHRRLSTSTVLSTDVQCLHLILRILSKQPNIPDVPVDSSRLSAYVPITKGAVPIPVVNFVSCLTTKGKWAAHFALTVEVQRQLVLRRCVENKQFFAWGWLLGGEEDAEDITRFGIHSFSHIVSAKSLRLWIDVVIEEDNFNGDQPNLNGMVLGIGLLGNLVHDVSVRAAQEKSPMVESIIRGVIRSLRFIWTTTDRLHPLPPFQELMRLYDSCF